MAGNDSQIAFFKKLRENIAEHISLADELAEILNVSNDSAYRRIRGETALSIEEILKIYTHFQVSFEDLTGQDKNGVKFGYLHLENTLQSFTNYFSSILNDIKVLKESKTKVFYAAADVPLFHHFLFKEHTAFKIFYWLKSVLNVPLPEKFSIEAVPADLQKIAMEMREHYELLPATEIWTTGSIQSTISQIEYYWDNRWFANENDAKLICNQFIEILDHLKKRAEQGHKKGEGISFDLYVSDTEIGNNCILVEANHYRKAYIRHHTFNFMTTTNDRFCEETQTWINGLIRKSSLISAVSEKERNRFFNSLKKQIEKLIQKIETE